MPCWGNLGIIFAVAGGGGGGVGCFLGRVTMICTKLGEAYMYSYPWGIPKPRATQEVIKGANAKMVVLLLVALPLQGTFCLGCFKPRGSKYLRVRGPWYLLRYQGTLWESEGNVHPRGLLIPSNRPLTPGTPLATLRALRALRRRRWAAALKWGSTGVRVPLFDYLQLGHVPQKGNRVYVYLQVVKKLSPDRSCSLQALLSNPAAEGQHCSGQNVRSFDLKSFHSYFVSLTSGSPSLSHLFRPLAAAMDLQGGVGGEAQGPALSLFFSEP